MDEREGRKLTSPETNPYRQAKGHRAAPSSPRQLDTRAIQSSNVLGQQPREPLAHCAGRVIQERFGMPRGM